jgi:predicted RNase H-like HicB family nuclease
VAAADTEEEAHALIREAIEFHLDGMREANAPILEPTARVDYVEIPHAA